LSERDWACDREGDSSQDKSVAAVSHTKEGSVLELKKTEGSQERHKDKDDVKHEDTVLEEANREMLLLENLLEKSGSNCEWKP